MKKLFVAALAASFAVSMIGQPAPPHGPDDSLTFSPDPSWMWDTSVNPPAMAYMQADFVWAVFNASAAKPTCK